MKRKQTKQAAVDTFLKRVAPPQEEPPTSLSGGVPEEVIAITGDNSSTRVIAPEHLPAGREVKVGDSDIDMTLRAEATVGVF